MSEIGRVIGRGFLSVLSVLAGLAGCSKQVETGPPLADPAAVAARIRSSTGPNGPYRLRFDWQYADAQGQLSGEGVARYNPRDSVRLDLFAPSDASMAVSLTAAGLTTLGELDDVRLPGPAFLYAMAGIFRPATGAPARGFTADSAQVLVFGAASDSLFAFVQGSRILRLEERRGVATERRVSRFCRITTRPLGPHRGDRGADTPCR